MKKVFSFDAETNGLWGQAFAIGALVYDESGREIARFVGRLPDSVVTDEWVQANVLPTMGDISVSHQSYEALVTDFAKFYLANKDDADIVVHMGVPVESNLLRDMHSQGCIGDFDGPYPLLDLVGELAQAGEDSTSCDKYVAKWKIVVPDFGTTHNPLYDSAVAAQVHRHLVSRRTTDK